MRDIRREAVYPHPRERVWLALTEPDVVETWLAASEGLEARVGCKFRFVTKPAPGFDGLIHCEVKEVKPMERFVYSWSSTKGLQHPTTVAWTLLQEGDGTRLVLEHSGFRGVSGVLLRSMLGMGWTKKVESFIGIALDKLEVADDSVDATRGTVLRGSWP